MYYFIIISLIAILGFGLYVIYKIEQIKAKKQLEKEAEEKRLAQIQALKEQEKLRIEQERLRLEYEHGNKLYQLNTHKIRLTLYNFRRDLKKFIDLYELVIVENYWVNEPFYSQFYELLIDMEKNEFMIVDQNAKVITMNLRNYNNQVQTSKAYEVYSSADIVESVIQTSMQDILQFKKYDAQNIVIAICVFVLEKSTHYLSKEVSQNIINDLLSTYVYALDIRKIVKLIKEENSSVSFIVKAFKDALMITETYPYTDSEVPKQLQLPKKLPQKFLQEF